MTPYQQHRQRWINCRRCELSEQRSRVVFARGQVPCEVLFVGEAPGPSEDVVGKPFVGPAGKLMDRIIKLALLSWRSYALTNLVACFPRKAKEAGINEPPREAIEACIPRLEEFMELCAPKLVVAVGKLAKKWAYAPEGVSQIDIIHPAAILRMDISQQGLAVQRSVAAISDAVSDF